MAPVRFPNKLEEARKWLRGHMVAGETYSAGDLQAQAVSDGIKRRTLQLAAQDVAVIEKEYGQRGIIAWHWRLK